MQDAKVKTEDLLAKALAIGEQADRDSLALKFKLMKFKRRIKTALFFIETGRVDEAKKMLKIAMEEVER